MRKRVPALGIMFLTLSIFLSPLAVPAEAGQDVAALLSNLRGNPKLIAPNDVLADFVNGAPETAVIVHLHPSAEAQALAAQSRSSKEVPAEFTRPGAAPYYNLQDESIRARLKATVTATVNRVLSELGTGGITVTRKFSYVFAFAAKVTPAALARIVASPAVVSVEKDHVLHSLKTHGTRSCQHINTRSHRPPPPPCLPLFLSPKLPSFIYWLRPPVRLIGRGDGYDG